MVGCVYLDLSKTFDTISHSILLDKLSLYGVQGSELAWFTDYIFSTTQLVEMFNIRSSVRSINTGVSQGSILGPLMFVIYFNDLQDHIIHGDIIQYADDTVKFFTDNKLETIQKALNEDMEQIGDYCRKNELLLNLKKGKTEVMLFGTAQRLRQQKENLEIVYNNTVINFVTEYLYLGNIPDNHLTLAKNINRSFKRASNRLRLLQYVRRNLTGKSAELIYKSMILPIPTHSSAIKTSINDSQNAKYESLERRASKVIGSNTIPKTRVVIESQICSLVQHCLHKNLGHETFDSYFEVMKHSKHTRNNNFSLRLPAVKLEVAKQGFSY